MTAAVAAVTETPPVEQQQRARGGNLCCDILQRLSNGIFLIVSCPVLLLLAILVIIMGGPVFFWSCCFVGRWNAILSQYERRPAIIGQIIDSKVVCGNEGGNWYGVTYRYRYASSTPARSDDFRRFQRTRHYVMIPRCISTRPANLDPGSPIRLAIIPDQPESAIPLESLRKMKLKGGVSDYIHVSNVSRKAKCTGCLESFFCDSWWFIFACISITLCFQLPTMYPIENVKGMLLPVLGTISGLWYLLGIPVCYWHHKQLRKDILVGGDELDREVDVTVTV